ncbi:MULTISPECIES: succinyl-diaminopimelate desuccinylase [Pseudoalteromonas]|uniref:Succinyl-diaminopimelate desuccinylase n=1 Tax=Pseudoalteromonas obscura TaxID=3048491 RepID=A0ABT7EML9_9GAMM|nr:MULTISPECIES: succinyl-diaminopimelate desuccinylase [Pseudoalteromonas]MBQ4838885.1 succinyl-diaminopimelate desuccinylase [Pseudoalteromonas luteoviolacea]MDK2596302.1 succinyl-diaminopimelate desuccinylase [Pseudoalteromonas sp. P94(2023)]
MPQVLQDDQQAHFTVVDILQQLIRARSVTPNDAGTLAYLSKQLSKLGFEVVDIESNGVKNLIAHRRFGEGPVLAYSGHVDVVPATTEGWIVDPFSGEIVDGIVYGRGAADMKGSIAAMLNATRSLCESELNRCGTLYWLITSDEEGEATDGSAIIAEYLREQDIALDACLVGEPTSHKLVGDTIKNGRRGAISGRFIVKGKAGHVAYPELAKNAAHIAGDLVTKLAQLSWPKDVAGSKTTLQVTGLTVPNIVDNLVPASCEITFNVRYSHGYKSDEICQRLAALSDTVDAEVNVVWERPCESFYTGKQAHNCFLSLIERVISDELGYYPTLSTAGGTSDGRFFANENTQVVECGVKNESIHQVNEHVPITDLVTIERIYERILAAYLTEGQSDSELVADCSRF